LKGVGVMGRYGSGWDCWILIPKVCSKREFC
jgi:hypothetical protein